jgi:hypothetical protein
MSWAQSLARWRAFFWQGSFPIQNSGRLVCLLAGMVIGATAIYRPRKNAVEWMSAVWEENAASERASAYLNALRAMDQAATNQIFIAKFQATGKSVLADYLHETES